MEITTLIPAYKPKYLIDLLQSFRNQTVKPAQIFISDDSPDRSFIKMLNSEPLKDLIKDLNITSFQGPQLGAYNNIRHLMHLYNKSTKYFYCCLRISSCLIYQYTYNNCKRKECHCKKY